MTAPRIIQRAALYLVLSLAAVFVLLPVFWLMRSSLMTLVEVFKYPRSSGPRACSGRISPWP